MKTLQQAAREHVKELAQFSAEDESTLRMAESIFLAGAAFTTRWISVEDELPERNQLVFLKALSYRENPERTIIGVGLLDKAGFWCDEFGRRYDLMQIKILAWRLIEYKE